MMIWLKILLVFGFVFMSKAREIRNSEAQSEVENVELKAAVIESEQIKSIPEIKEFASLEPTEKTASSSENAARSDNATRTKSKMLSGYFTRTYFRKIFKSVIIQVS